MASSGPPRPRNIAADMTVSSRLFLSRVALIIFAIAALFVVDTFLARMERAEVRGGARRLFLEGSMLMQQGRLGDAIERFKDAVSGERENREYRLALADALVAHQNFPEARTVLAALLEQDSTDAQANLELARVLAQQGSTA